MDLSSALAGVVLLFFLAFGKTWLQKFLLELLPAPSQALLALRNLYADPVSGPKQSFCIVVAWLANDKSGDAGRVIERAFRRNVRGVDLQLSARTIAPTGDADRWEPLMRERAQSLLQSWRADVAIVGDVNRSGSVMHLWFVPRDGDGTVFVAPTNAYA